MQHTQVAKLVLTSPEGIILPYGSSGRRNIPGGAIEEGESPIDALERELDEELGYTLPEASARLVGKHSFYINNPGSLPEVRHWIIFAASTTLGPDDFKIGAEIEGLDVLDRPNICTNPHVTKSAKVAVALASRATRLYNLF